MSIQVQQMLAAVAAIGGLLSFLAVMQSPHKLSRNARKAISVALPEDSRQEITSLLDALNGRVRITNFQINLLSLIGLFIGSALAASVWLMTENPYISIGLGTVIVVLFFYYPRQKFVKGYSRSMLETLDNEAPALIGFMQRSVGVAGLSVQVSFENYCKVFPETHTAALVQEMPLNVSIPDALMALEIPSEEAPNWSQVVQTLAEIGDYGEPNKVLIDLRDRVRMRAEQKVRRIIKQKVFSAPVATVMLMLPALMAVLLGSAMIQAFMTLSGTSLGG